MEVWRQSDEVRIAVAQERLRLERPPRMRHPVRDPEVFRG
jgi:hypothetical protein